MKAGPLPKSRPDLLPEDADPVWRLLCRAPLPEPDAWFTARTLARCRHEGLGMDAGAGFRAHFTQNWSWALGGGLGFCLAVVLLGTQSPPENEKVAEKIDKQKSVQEAFEIMASVDSDSDSSSPSSWQDSSL